ncbi:MarR family transcriptional regulator [Bacillus mangrovi]|uniref:MarR family transcriptional regulator n=1 Tax=Metabacillus mangrovi TaxID=1491830 RepID=A0A7X2S1N5_9BACI|nr:MarR family transcriptional regulator [Metabacillus mangrovi]MTH51817.1 MarR family transcriptional regulator [Metabacillus mangrovi]
MRECCAEDEELFHRLYEINKSIVPKFERCTGLSQSRLEILHKLYEKEEMTQRELQKAVLIDHAAVTRHIKQLEDRGSVSRRKNPEDTRFTYVKLTDEGRRKMAAYREEKQRFVSNVLKGFTKEERNSLKGMLSRLQQNIEEID